MNHIPDLSRLERMEREHPELCPVFDAVIVNCAAGIIRCLAEKDRLSRAGTGEPAEPPFLLRESQLGAETTQLAKGEAA
jgi:hypothetical protein